MREVASTSKSRVIAALIRLLEIADLCHIASITDCHNAEAYSTFPRQCIASGRVGKDIHGRL